MKYTVTSGKGGVISVKHETNSLLSALWFLYKLNLKTAEIYWKGLRIK